MSGSKEIAYMEKHSPRCLGSLVTLAPPDLRRYIQELLGANTTAFSPICECGNDVAGIAVPSDFGPTEISCAKCGKTRVVFDPRQHGYDGECGNNADVEISESDAHACSRCGNRTFQIALGFQYSGETDILEETDPPKVNPEDLFGWFMAAVRCQKCGNIEKAAEEECA